MERGWLDRSLSGGRARLLSGVRAASPGDGDDHEDGDDDDDRGGVHGTSLGEAMIRRIIDASLVDGPAGPGLCGVVVEDGHLASVGIGDAE
jgi:hypothetical protein